MTNFEYTKAYETASSFVDVVYVNENDDYVVVELTNDFYKYKGVPAYAVSNLVGAGSVGTHYNTVFKPAYGPGEHLGEWLEVDEVQVPLNKPAGDVRKDLIVGTINVDNDLANVIAFPVAATLSANRDGAVAPTKEFSLNVFDQTVSGAPIADASTETKEFSLNIFDNAEDTGLYFEEDNEIGVKSIVVHFDLYGKKAKYKADSDDPYDALEELHEHLVRVSVKAKDVRPRKVVIKFD